mmetsp:Transcript_19021/g.39902  ORF Transcript_19021/g.39902 Transcript_19021/m.39902 type:complete len:177 (+) Transcript_19021:1154-1684(+)
MPHSEYPSGLAPLCKAYTDYAKAYASGHDLGEVTNIKASFSIPNLNALTHQCGQSRIWGGMHFNASIPAGYALVDGLGKVGFDRMQLIHRGTNLTNTWRSDDPRPDPRQCAGYAELVSHALSTIGVGTRLDIHWPSEDEFYPGTVAIHHLGNIYTVLYNDGYMERMDLTKERFNLI